MKTFLESKNVIILGILLLFIQQYYIKKDSNDPNRVLDEAKILTLRKYATSIDKAGKDLIIVLNNSNRIDKEGNYLEFIDRAVMEKALPILKENNYTVLTLNLPCIEDIACLNKYYEISSLIIELKPRAVIFNSPSSGVNTDTIGTTLDKENIPIYVYQTESALNYKLYIGPNNEGLGREIVKGISSNLKRGDKVLYVETVRLINGNKLDNGYKRINAAREELKKIGVEEYATIFTEWSKSKTYTELIRLLSKDTNNLKYIITPSVETAEGAVLALEQLGLQKEIKIICADITPVSLKLLIDGQIEGLVGQELAKQGESLGNNIVKDLEEDKKDIDSVEGKKNQVLFNTIYIDRYNVDEYKQPNGEFIY